MSCLATQISSNSTVFYYFYSILFLLLERHKIAMRSTAVCIENLIQFITNEILKY